MSGDEIEKNDKFDNMIRAIKSREAFPKYSVVLWEVLRIICYVYITIGFLSYLNSKVDFK